MTRDAKLPKPTRMYRPKAWSHDVENAFRLQEVGFKDVHEYASMFGDPQQWPESGLYRMLRVKKTGYFTYWRQERECPDSCLHRVKMYVFE